ncbi:MAG: GGDEF domain-containing protein [Chloroflexales bacterium]
MQPVTPSPEGYQLTAEEFGEFKQTVLVDNLKHFLAILVLGALINTFAILMNRQSSGQFNENTWLRMAWIGASLLYLLLIGKPGTRPYRYQQAVFLGAASLSLFFAARLTAIASATQGGTFIFVINLLLTSTFFILSLRQIIGVAGPSLIYLGGAIFQAIGGGLALSLTSNIINIVAVTAFAIMIAQFLYRARHQRFCYEVVIRQHNAYLHNLATLDGLTGIPNRRKVNEMLTLLQTLATREQLAVSVLMLDLDNFKLYNDTYGHLAGDELLKVVAVALQSTLQRTSDFFGRYGGEEFIVILPATNAAGAVVVAEQMCASVFALAVPHRGAPVGVVTVSIGLAVGIPTKDAGIDAIVHRADQALYRAKQAGKNRVAS